jgi:hypothetical protein
LINDYQYVVLKLYPFDVTDPNEQDSILKNILLLYPEKTQKEKEVVKSKTFTEVDVLKKYLDILEPFVKKSTLSNKDIILYDIKRVQMINSISSAVELVKKIIKTVYNKSTIEAKKDMYKSIVPIAKHVSVFIFPPWVFRVLISFQSAFSVMKILF